MSRIIFLLIFFLTSCSPAKIESNINFSENMTIKQFSQKLEEYAETNSYPNIDN